jgi:hypothetical protein
MRVLLSILLAAGAAALGLSDPGAFGPALYVAGAAALAALRLLVRRPRARTPRKHIPEGPLRPKKAAGPYIVVDGSNVMHWAGDAPSVVPLREVVRKLAAEGYTPGVVFDANAGYLIEGRYRHDGDMARLLGLPPDRVMVVDKGSPADATILEAARDMQARVVTNDRFRDWADRYPEVIPPGFLVRSG